jgi:hypothetical protein
LSIIAANLALGLQKTPLLIDALIMVTIFQIVYGETHPVLDECMETVRQFAERAGHEYKILRPAADDMSESTEIRFASDYYRIRMAAELAPCAYFDWDVRLSPQFDIANYNRAMWGNPPIALFYLPSPEIALETLADIDARRMITGGAKDNDCDYCFIRRLMFNCDHYEHLSHHRARRMRPRGDTNV